MGNDHFRRQSTRGHVMYPSQAVDISRQAFTPDGPDLVGNKTVEPTTEKGILILEDGVPGSSDVYHHACLLHLTYPAACFSSGTVIVSASLASSSSSRTGPRFPGRPRCSETRCCFASSCLLCGSVGRCPPGSKTVRSRPSAPTYPARPVSR